MLIKKIGKASFITGIFTLLSLGFVLTIQSIVGKVYGAEGLGLYAALIMFVNIYSLISILGLPSALSKYVAEFEEKNQLDKAKTGMNSVLIFALVSSLGFGAIALFLTPLLGKILHIHVTLNMSIAVSLTLFFYNMTRLSQFYNQGLLRALKSGLIQSSMLLGILLVIISAKFTRPIPLHYAILIGCVFSGTLGIFLSIDPKQRGTFFSKAILKEIIKFSLPIALISHLYFISQWIDRFALGVFIGVAEIGVFTAAVTITNGVLQIPVSLSQVLLPSFSKVNVYGKEKLQNATNLTLKFMSLFLFLSSIIVFIMSRDIIRFLYGLRFDEFKDAILLIKILVPNIFLSAITIPLSNLITGAGKPKYAAKISLFGIIIQIILIVTLTINYGIIGTAIGRSLTLFIIAILNIFVVRKVMKVVIFWKNLMLPLGISLISVFIFNLLFYAGVSRIAGLILCSLVYVGLGWKYVLGLDEQKLIEQLIKGYFYKSK